MLAGRAGWRWQGGVKVLGFQAIFRVTDGFYSSDFTSQNNTSHNNTSHNNTSHKIKWGDWPMKKGYWDALSLLWRSRCWIGWLFNWTWPHPIQSPRSQCLPVWVRWPRPLGPTALLRYSCSRVPWSWPCGLRRLSVVVGWIGNTFLSPAKTGSVGIGFDPNLDRVPPTSCHPELLPSLLWTAMSEQPHVGALLRRHES